MTVWIIPTCEGPRYCNAWHKNKQTKPDYTVWPFIFMMAFLLFVVRCPIIPKSFHWVSVFQTLLLDAHSAKAKYLFQQDKFYDVTYDTGDKSIQCGRKVDALKIWTMWKSKGDAGMAAGVDHLFECSRFVVLYIHVCSMFRPKAPWKAKGGYLNNVYIDRK